MGEFINKDLSVSRTFETRLEFFWYFDPGYFPDNDEERRQQRRLTRIKDKLPRELQEQLEMIIRSGLKIIIPEKKTTDKIIYSPSGLSHESYEVLISNEKKYIEILYDTSAIKIEEDWKNIFLDFHSKLMAWIDQEFEIASEGKAVRFNKKK
ncbi:MAG: hypothetical protein LBE92_21125 [Chryseobacterium sp.]|uniref:hypothetical protein n=1 Tax=Chryseobacterium sp. TaxID=1871047 RepID=UPI0028278908|nr:hypothetical protein [Chryseobacterium sp.]MDR2238640.1 hypothetical protein [Chryseobacterium sp.]